MKTGEDDEANHITLAGLSSYMGILMQEYSRNNREINQFLKYVKIKLIIALAPG